MNIFRSSTTTKLKERPPKKKLTLFQRSKSTGHVHDNKLEDRSSIGTSKATSLNCLGKVGNNQNTNHNNKPTREKSIFYRFRRKKNHARDAEQIFEPVPLRYEAITALITRLEQMRAHEKEGIFRVTGNLAEISCLVRELANEPLPLLPFGPHLGVHEYAGALKLYLRESPEPIVPFSHVNTFVNAIKNADGALWKVFGVCEAVAGLPEENRKMLRELIFYLKRVVDNSGYTLMDLNNLAISFGPSIFRQEREPPDFSAIGTSCEILTILVSHLHDIFHEHPLPTSSSRFSELDPFVQRKPVQFRPLSDPLQLPNPEDITSSNQGVETPFATTVILPATARDGCISKTGLQLRLKNRVSPPKPSLPPRIPLESTKYGAFISSNIQTARTSRQHHDHC